MSTYPKKILNLVLIGSIISFLLFVSSITLITLVISYKGFLLWNNSAVEQSTSNSSSTGYATYFNLVETSGWSGFFSQKNFNLWPAVVSFYVFSLLFAIVNFLTSALIIRIGVKVNNTNLLKVGVNLMFLWGVGTILGFRFWSKNNKVHKRSSLQPRKSDKPKTIKLSKMEKDLIAKISS